MMRHRKGIGTLPVPELNAQQDEVHDKKDNKWRGVRHVSLAE